MMCQDLEELSGAYVLDAVTPQERQEIEEHLADCPDCTRLVQELQIVTEFLPLSVPPTKPSPLLQERVLAGIRTEAARSTIQRPRLRAQRGRHWRNWTNQLVAVAAILVFALLSAMTIWNISLHQQIATIHTPAPAYITYAVKGTSTNPTASGQLLYIPSQNISVLTIKGLPQTRGSYVYQGWLLHGQQPVSIGLLNVHDGIASGSFQGNMQGYDGAAVSLEPGPSASPDAPKGPIVATGKLTIPTSTGHNVV